MKSAKGLRSFAVAVLCAVSFAAAAEVPSRYRVTLIWKRIIDPSHENHEFEVTDINDKGQVSGWRLSDSATDGAFLWRAGKFQNVAPPSGGFYSRALGVNDWSELVGDYRTDAPDRGRGFFWRGGRMREITALPGETNLDVVHINNRR